MTVAVTMMLVKANIEWSLTKYNGSDDQNKCDSISFLLSKKLWGGYIFMFYHFFNPKA